MTNIFKQRIYRLCIASATFFLAGFLIYAIGDMGLVAQPLYFPCYVFIFAGIVFGFKALDVWSGWLEDSSEDTGIRRGSNAYPITFYTEAVLVTLSIICLLAFTIMRSGPTIEEEGVLGLALFVAAACMCMARLSSS
jgi:hypothetical protein